MAGMGRSWAERNPWLGLGSGSGGRLRQAAGAVACCLFLATCQAQTNYQRLLSFGPSAVFGSTPRAPLSEASDGWLYGTTSSGGTNGFGTLFKVRRTGLNFTLLHSFSEAYFPYSRLVETADGSLWGTASSGPGNAGTIFKLNKDGSGFALVHLFSSAPSDGAQPMAGLTLGPGGVLYGTTISGGASNLGTVFAIDPASSNYTVRYSFMGPTNGPDGSAPGASLCLGTDGALSGTTQTGGSNDLGTVFKLNGDATGYTVLHHFTGAAGDGRLPLSGLVQSSDGMLYGTTYYGGANDLGTVYTLSTNGLNYSVLFSFTGADQGYEPYGGVVQGTDGRLYGTTRYGGSKDGGTVFALNTAGNGFTVLHSFLGTGGDGSQPFADLLRASDGALYGSTYWGGDYATNGVNGTLFRMYSLVPPVILGQGLVDGHFQVSFSGPDGQPYSLLASTNVSLSPDQWMVLTNGTFSGPASFTEPAAAQGQAWFYRLRSP